MDLNGGRNNEKKEIPKVHPQPSAVPNEIRGGGRVYVKDQSIPRGA